MSAGLWYVSRSTGLLALVLFTATVVLGALNTARFATSGWPRFTITALHRNVALLSVAFLAVHITSAIVDGYVSLTWTDVVVPFVSSYQPFWLGLGTLALDLLLAVLVTSLLRTRMPPRGWRAVHWLAYLSWPLAVLHGIGMADDDTTPALVIAGCCVLATAFAVGWRLLASHPDTEARALSRPEPR
jgi:sulfoxide reductase heme-binding subunit YedZ